MSDTRADTPPTLTGPCIGVCKFLRAGPQGDAHCIGCSMTEAQKAKFKALSSDADRLALLESIVAQQAGLGGYRHWPEAYEAKCIRKGARLPDLARRNRAA